MGAVNIDNTGSGSAVTLSSNGTALLLNGSAVGGGASTLTISNKTGDYTVVAADLGRIISCSGGNITISLTASVTLGSGFNCWIWNSTDGGSNHTVTIDPNGSETIDGRPTLTLYRGQGIEIVSDGTNWKTGAQKTLRGYSENMRVDYMGRPSAGGEGSIAMGYDNYSWAPASAAGDASFAVFGNANASRATAIGHNSSGRSAQAVSSAGAAAFNGSYASGTDSFAAAVANNTSSYGATGENSVAIGKFAKASGTGSIAISSYGALASGYGGVAIGSSTTASAGGDGSIAIGNSSTASANASIALGNYAQSATTGKYSYASGGFVAVPGTAQTGVFVLSIPTTDASATALTTNQSGQSGTNQVILPNNSAYAFSGIIVARQQAAGGTASAAWRVEGLIRREANAASTVLVNNALTVIDNQPGWSIVLSADTTRGGLAITATGAAATNIRWVATIQTSEVTYA